MLLLFSNIVEIVTTAKNLHLIFGRNFPTNPFSLVLRLAFGRMLNEIVAKRSSPLLRIECTQFTSEKWTHSTKSEKWNSLKEKGTRNSFSKPIAIEVYGDIVKNSYNSAFLLFCNYFRNDFNFIFAEKDALVSIYRLSKRSLPLTTAMTNSMLRFNWHKFPYH